MKIGIVNDVAMAAEALRRIVAGSREHQLLWTARSGLEAVTLCAAQRPDLVLMDLNMPGLDGVEATRQIMQKSPCAILIVTGRPEDNVSLVFRALGAGALDVTATPLMEGGGGGAALLAKIKTIGKLVRASSSESQANKSAEANGGEVRHLIAIGASTGGPLAVAHILRRWIPPPATALVVIQHIDENFATHFCKWLGEQLPFPARVIEDGDVLTPGSLLIAKTNDHLTLDARKRLRYEREPADYAYRPSVDVFFHCVARHWQGDATGILLTGMGRDGAVGLLAMREAGHVTLAQDEASSAVYGMPRAAASIDAAQQILSLNQIALYLQARPGSKMA